MKKMIFFAALTIPLMAGTMYTGYSSSTQKQKAAQTQKLDAKKDDLIASHRNTYLIANQEATAEEWKTFNKDEFEQKVKANELQITELNVKIGKSSGLFDSFSLEKIAKLEKENRFLKGRLDAYEKFQSKIKSN
jgi:hypothetical protein